MGATAKALVPPLVRGSIERAPVTALSLSDLLARAQTLNVNEIRQLARFVPVIILIPESSPGQTAPPKVPCNRSCLSFLHPCSSHIAIGAVLRVRYRVPGAFNHVNGRSMHLYCTDRGSPTVVLEAGGGEDWLIWQTGLC
jgi:hypothetical protein